MEIRMVLKGILFYVVGTLGARSTSGSVFWVLWCISPMPVPASPFASWLSMGQSALVSVLGIFSVLGPATYTKMIFVFTLVTFFAPHWALSWWMRCAALAACLTWATLDSVAVTFFKLDYLDCIDHCCCCKSYVWFVLVEVFHHHLVPLGMWEEGLIHNILSPLLWSDPPFDFKMFCCMKKQLCSHCAANRPKARVLKGIAK